MRPKRTVVPKVSFEKSSLWFEPRVVDDFRQFFHENTRKLDENDNLQSVFFTNIRENSMEMRDFVQIFGMKFWHYFLDTSL